VFVGVCFWRWNADRKAITWKRRCIDWCADHRFDQVLQLWRGIEPIHNDLTKQALDIPQRFVAVDIWIAEFYQDRADVLMFPLDGATCPSTNKRCSRRLCSALLNGSPRSSFVSMPK
jgi:hypothetical protein